MGSNGNTGAGSTIMGTTTGGLSWTAQNPPAGTSTIELGLMSEHRRLLRRRVRLGPGLGQRGLRLDAQPIPAEVSGLNGISCATTSDCTAVGFGIFGSPVVIGTSDGGTSWTPETVPPGVGILTAVSCVSTHRSVTR